MGRKYFIPIEINSFSGGLSLFSLVTFLLKLVINAMKRDLEVHLKLVICEEKEYNFQTKIEKKLNAKVKSSRNQINGKPSQVVGLDVENILRQNYHW